MGVLQGKLQGEDLRSDFEGAICGNGPPSGLQFEEFIDEFIEQFIEQFRPC